MPVRYTFVGDVFHLIMEGSYSTADIRQVFLSAFEDPGFPERPRFVFDVSRSDELAERGADQIKAIAGFLSEHADRFEKRCAVVVSKPIQYGLARMGAAFASARDSEVLVFTSFDEAVAWLDAESAG